MFRRENRNTGGRTEQITSSKKNGLSNAPNVNVGNGTRDVEKRNVKETKASARSSRASVNNVPQTNTAQAANGAAQSSGDNARHRPIQKRNEAVRPVANEKKIHMTRQISSTIGTINELYGLLVKSSSLLMKNETKNILIKNLNKLLHNLKSTNQDTLTNAVIAFAKETSLGDPLAAIKNFVTMSRQTVGKLKERSFDVTKEPLSELQLKEGNLTNALRNAVKTLEAENRRIEAERREVENKRRPLGDAVSRIYNPSCGLGDVLEFAGLVYTLNKQEAMVAIGNAVNDVKFRLGVDKIAIIEHLNRMVSIARSCVSPKNHIELVNRALWYVTSFETQCMRNNPISISDEEVEAELNRLVNS
ncbi:MAG: hypothetical protein LBR91_01035 [Puniceicoccales bacterium]|nr:hypothetical protein [Puniceicoccales bacterium]